MKEADFTGLFTSKAFKKFKTNILLVAFTIKYFILTYFWKLSCILSSFLWHVFTTMFLAYFNAEQMYLFGNITIIRLVASFILFNSRLSSPAIVLRIVSLQGVMSQICPARSTFSTPLTVGAEKALVVVNLKLNHLLPEVMFHAFWKSVCGGRLGGGVTVWFAVGCSKCMWCAKTCKTIMFSISCKEQNQNYSHTSYSYTSTSLHPFITKKMFHSSSNLFLLPAFVLFNFVFASAL